MIASIFTKSFLRLFSGPIIWALHFLFIYGFTGITCARPALRQDWLGLSLTAWAVILASIVAILAIVLVNIRRWRTDIEPSNIIFTQWTATALAILAVVAIIWEAVPVFLIPACR